MLAYKGFNDKLQCAPADKCFQYEVGKTYEEPTADLCHEGFHACETPLDVFSHYAPADSRYCAVDLDEVSDQKDGDSKRVGKKITIKAEIGIAGLVKAHLKYINEKVDWENAKESNTGDCSAATNTGDCSAATNTGYCSAATNTGNRSAATNTGDCSAATNTGNYSAASVGGKESIAIVTGYNSKAKGALGDWIVLTERDDNYHILGVKAVKVDGKKVKADTYYQLQGKKILEVK